MADSIGGWTTKNPYLNGNFAPVIEECDHENLEIDGEIPKELEGAFLRIGSNPVYLKDPDLYHWFDGDGMVHCLQLADGKARYRNRFIKTKGLELESEAGEALWGGLNHPPDFSNPNGPFKNVANTAMVMHGDEMMALWEGGPPHVFTVPDLETVRLNDYEGGLPHPFSAHPKVDMHTGEMITFGYGPMGDRPVGLSVVGADGTLKRSTSIPLKKPVMMHDMAITERFNVILDLPMTFDLQRMMGGGQMLDWEPENGSRIGLMPRHGDGDEIRWFEISSCFVFHVVTAWEEGDRVVLIACRMDKPILVGSAAGDGEKPSRGTRIYRWDLNTATGRVEEAPLFDLGGDFPRFNEIHMGRKHRFAYMPCHLGPGATFNGLAKLDLGDASTQTVDLGIDGQMSEACFAARPGATAEDEGWLVAFTHDETKAQSAGVVFDAQDVAAGPLATVKIPSRIPYGFHAAWVPANAYTA